MLNESNEQTKTAKRSLFVSDRDATETEGLVINKTRLLFVCVCVCVCVCPDCIEGNINRIYI